MGSAYVTVVSSATAGAIQAAGTTFTAQALAAFGAGTLTFVGGTFLLGVGAIIVRASPSLQDWLGSFFSEVNTGLVEYHFNIPPLCAPGYDPSVENN